jgi:murein DD-endopeptidase MepM/ murein hydrolase activator NlpD
MTAVLPVGHAPVTAGFPAYPSGLPHYGVDFGVPIGTPVYANRDGMVSEAGWDTTGFGNVVKQQIGNVELIYGHNSALVVHAGEMVQAGQLIAYSGESGHATGPHCHFQVNIGGDYNAYAVDPWPYLTGAVGTPTPVSGVPGAGPGTGWTFLAEKGQLLVPQPPTLVAAAGLTTAHFSPPRKSF